MIDKIKSLFTRTPKPENITTTQLNQLIKRSYEAARPSDQFPLIPASLSPNNATQTATERLRDKARYLDENHDLSISILDTLVGKIVGKKITITPMIKTKSGELDTELNDKIAAELKLFELRPEVTGQLSINKADRLLCRSWLRDGEVLQRFIYGNVAGVEHSSNVPLSLELVEADYLSFMKNEAAGNNNIIQSVEVNKWGRPQKFHLLKQSPYEINATVGQGLSLETFPVLARDICHIKFTRRISQIRGVTIFHGIIKRMESIKEYEESEQVAARVAAAFCAYIKRDIEMGDGETSNRGGNLSMSPGMIFDDLSPGEDVGTISSDRPNSGLFDFRNAMLRAAAGGTMTNFSAISGYYDGSYSSQRQELVESRVNYEILRGEFISEIKVPVYLKFLELGFKFGIFQINSNTDVGTMFDVEINGIPTAWIDPKKEIESFKIAKEEKFMSTSMIVRLMGNDPVTVAKEVEEEIKNEPEPEIEPEPEQEPEPGEVENEKEE